jgi:mannose-6-phosphate isomerase-like protein (cupin superfamily)
MADTAHKIGYGMNDLVAKSLETPDGSDIFLDDSRRSQITLARVVIGRGVYRPGWRWSAHVRPMAGHESEAHVGYIISGRMIVRGPDGARVEVGPGDAFEAPPGHDAWVVGDEPCVALDFAARSSSARIA